ncbi:MAG: xanthine dehydrogenase accessory protein XdhC [Silicimonas sp.]|jgi:xanthine dehydrogenase accessory factor|nr:xanthine dehydrogenase accessory protein XdhC [Silicimonas sp.]
MLAGPLPVARVVITSRKGSSPREVGTSMLVWADRVEGTIGGGALELQAIAQAREVLESGVPRVHRQALGPDLGQCCGGAVTTLIERWDRQALEAIEGAVIRPMPGTEGEMPAALMRREVTQPGVTEGWMAEPVAAPAREIWVWGAGHVGTALMNVLMPLPGFRLTWADPDPARFPTGLPDHVRTLAAENPADLANLAPAEAEHFVMTYSHAIDLDICHRVLSRPFRFLGLIGSKSKSARFRSRLSALGHSPAQIERMICPIGDPSLGRHPQAIALGVATGILRGETLGAAIMDKSA